MAPRGIPQIEVTFDIDANGIMNVKAKDLGTGKEQQITITASTKLSKDQIDKMMKEAEKFASDDAKKKEKAEVLNQAETILYTAQKTVSEAGDKITAEQKEQINKAAESLKEAQKTEDLAKIKAETESLTKVMNEVATVMYQQAAQQYQAQQQAEQGQNKQGPQAGQHSNSGKDPNVVDADYEVVHDKK